MISNPKRPVITPTQLEVHGGKISFEVSATVPAGTLSPGVIYRLVPQFSYDSRQIKLSPIEFEHSKRLQSIKKDYSFDYSPGMDDGKLEIMGNFTNIKSGEKAAYRIPLASTKGLITTSRLLKEEYTPAYSKQEPYYIDRDTLRLDFEFAIGGSELLDSQLNNWLNAMLDSLISSDRIILGSRIIGTHSPVGSDEVNRRIAQERTQAVQKVFDEKMRQRTSSEFDRLSVDLEVDFNSWSIFIEKMNTTDLQEEIKESILEITANSSDYGAVKSQLLRLPNIAQISSKLFPRLQMSRLEIGYARLIEDDNEFRSIVNTIISPSLDSTSLSTDDILSIAHQERDGRRRLQLYQSVDQKSAPWELYNDWAATYLDFYNQWDEDRGRQHVTKVYDLLKRSIEIQPSKEAYTNLGVVNAIGGRFELSIAYFDKAEATPGNDNTNNSYHKSRGVAALKSGNY